MHSRIIELSKEPVLKQERISEASIPEWFCNTIADYTDANTDRDHDIKWFLSCVGNYVDEGGYLEWHLPMCARPSLPLRGLRSW